MNDDHINKLKKCFYNPEFPEISQVVTSFVLGFTLANLSRGLFFLIGFLILYEIIFVWACEGKEWRFENRLLIVLVYIFGYILGKAFLGEEVKF
jgi:hypothetical protein